MFVASGFDGNYCKPDTSATRERNEKRLVLDFVGFFFFLFGFFLKLLMLARLLHLGNISRKTLTMN